jgi:hypothetical protein
MKPEQPFGERLRSPVWHLPEELHRFATGDLAGVVSANTIGHCQEEAVARLDLPRADLREPGICIGGVRQDGVLVIRTDLPGV